MQFLFTISIEDITKWNKSGAQGLCIFSYVVGHVYNPAISIHDSPMDYIPKPSVKLSFRIDKFILLSRFAILVEKVLPILPKNFNVIQFHSRPFLLSFNRASRKTLSPHRLCRCRNGQEYQSHMFCEWTGIYWLVYINWGTNHWHKSQPQNVRGGRR